MEKLTKNENQIMLQDNSLLLDVKRFEHAQRVAKMLASSTMVPDHFKNNLGNCIIALNYADRVGLDPFMIMQKMYIIHGKPAIETQLQIALFNKCDKFSVLKYKLSGKDDQRSCISFATDKRTNIELEGPEVSIEMAKKEGWYSKKGSKWQTLPDLMLRYRAAAFFVRLYAPETSLGVYTKDELLDVKNIIDQTPEIQQVEQEIKENANKEILDPENLNQEIECTSVMSDAEKAGIEEEEKKMSTQERSDW